MIEVRGHSGVLSYSGGRLTISEPATGRLVAVVEVTELAKVVFAWVDDDSFVAQVLFRAADFAIEGTTTNRQPYVVLLSAEMLDAANELAAAIQADLLESRRLPPSAPDLVAPAPVPGRDGPERPDVQGAQARMQYAGNVGPAVRAMHSYARADEYVLEMATAMRLGQPGLLVVSTLRILFIAPGRNRVVTREYPLAGIIAASVRNNAAGFPTDLNLSDGFRGLQFLDGHHQDVARFAGAVNFAADLEATVGTLAPVSPSPTELFAEWQLLLERRALGMVEEDEFQAQGQGLLLALPN